VIVWLWDAGSGHGVTDDQARARRAAEVLMHSGRADAARVEKALAVTGISALASGYRARVDSPAPAGRPDQVGAVPRRTATGGLMTGRARKQEPGSGLR